MKIINLGLAKTGLQSLKRALEILGYNIRDGGNNLELKNNDAFVGEFAHKVNYNKPDVKFILTIRKSPEIWYNSICRAFYKEPATWKRYKMIFGCENPKNCKDLFIKKYKENEIIVREYFKNSENLLILCFENGIRWDGLCNYLNKSIPDVPFPHRNKTSLMKSNLLSNVELTNTFLKTLSPHKNSSLVDLGCLDGSYSIEFGLHGYNVTGIEIRKKNYKKCLNNLEKYPQVKNNVKFILDDVRNLENYENFDICFASGILYHLDKPAEFLRKIYKKTNKVLMLFTHFAAEESSFNLSEWTINEGKKGKWLKEYDKNKTSDEIENLIWGAYGNYKSFWLSKSALIETLKEVGFKDIKENRSFLKEKTEDFIKKYSRSFFIAKK